VSTPADQLPELGRIGHGRGGFCKTEGSMKLKEAFAVAKASCGISLGQIAPNQFLQQLITIQLADHAACIVVVGDIGGILGQQISDDLVDRVVTLFPQSIEHSPEDAAHIVFVVTGDCELNGIFRHGFDLLMVDTGIISQK
jgi:hypothetical protein